MTENEIIKIAIAGNTGSGKSTLANTYCDLKNPERYMITIGVRHLTKKINYSDQTINLAIADLAGDKKFIDVMTPLMTGTLGMIYVVDLTRLNNENEINEFENVIRLCESKISKNGVPSVIIGNKKDCLINTEEYRIVQIPPGVEKEIFGKDGSRVPAEIDIMTALYDQDKQQKPTCLKPYMECSAINGLNVKFAYHFLTGMILSNFHPEKVDEFKNELEILVNRNNENTRINPGAGLEFYKGFLDYWAGQTRLII